MPKHPAYCVMHLHVPTYFHDRISKAVTRADPVSIKLDLTGTPEHRLYVTVGQKKRILEAVEKGRRDMTLRMSAKQAKYNKECEGGFLAGLLQSAVRFLPSILAGIAAGTAEYHKEREWYVSWKTRSYLSNYSFWRRIDNQTCSATQARRILCKAWGA